MVDVLLTCPVVMAYAVMAYVVMAHMFYDRVVDVVLTCLEKWHGDRRRGGYAE